MSTETLISAPTTTRLLEKLRDAMRDHAIPLPSIGPRHLGWIDCTLSLFDNRIEFDLNSPEGDMNFATWKHDEPIPETVLAHLRTL